MASPFSPAAAVTADEARTMAKEVFIYAYPMLYNYPTLYGQAVDVHPKSTSGIQQADRLGAKNGDLIVYCTFSDKKGILTANATTPYVIAFGGLSNRDRFYREVGLCPRQRLGRKGANG